MLKVSEVSPKAILLKVKTETLVKEALPHMLISKRVRKLKCYLSESALTVYKAVYKNKDTTAWY